MDISTYNSRFLSIQGKRINHSITYSQYSALKLELDLDFVNDTDSHVEFKKELAKAIEDRKLASKSKLESERRMEIAKGLIASKRSAKA